MRDESLRQGLVLTGSTQRYLRLLLDHQVLLCVPSLLHLETRVFRACAHFVNRCFPNSRRNHLHNYRGPLSSLLLWLPVAHSPRGLALPGRDGCVQAPHERLRRRIRFTVFDCCTFCVRTLHQTRKF